MTQYGSHPSRRWIEDPSDPVWFWFVFNGPHGERFSWDRHTIDLLRDSMNEREVSSPGFIDSARTVALKAMKLPNAAMIRTAIQVLCVAGTVEDLELIKSLLKHPTEEVRVDARCCLFERGIHKA
jgi:hypothetical protein